MHICRHSLFVVYVLELDILKNYEISKTMKDSKLSYLGFTRWGRQGASRLHLRSLLVGLLQVRR